MQIGGAAQTVQVHGREFAVDAIYSYARARSLPAHAGSDEWAVGSSGDRPGDLVVATTRRYPAACAQPTVGPAAIRYHPSLQVPSPAFTYALRLRLQDPHRKSAVPVAACTLRSLCRQ